MVIISGYLDRTIPPRSIAGLDLYGDASRSGFHLYLNPVNWTIVRDFPAEHKRVLRRCMKKIERDASKRQFIFRECIFLLSIK